MNPAIQITKAVCCAGMVVTHGFYWAATASGRFVFPPGSLLASLAPWLTWTAFFPLLLPFTAGCVHAIGTTEAGPSEFAGRSFQSVAWEACALAVLGGVMNLLAAGWYAVLAWNVLQFIAVAMLLMWALLRLGGRWALVAAGGVALLGTDALRPWLLEHSQAAWALILVGDPRDFHSWPVLPWLPTIIAGFLVTDLAARGLPRRGLVTTLLAVGAGLVVAAAVSGSLIPAFVPANFIGPEIMHPRAMRALGIIGLGLVLLGSAHLVAPRLRLAPRGFVLCFSRGILWIYIAHMVVGNRLARALRQVVNPAELAAAGQPLLAAGYILGFMACLLALSWAVGWLSIVLLAEKRLEIRVRRAA